MNYKGKSDAFKRTMQKLVHEERVEAILGLGTLYWRYNVPVTTVSKAQYKRALKLIKTYTQQLEENQKEKNQKEEISIDHKFPNLKKAPNGFGKAGYFIADFYLHDYTSDIKLLNKLSLYFLKYHDIPTKELSKISIRQLPPISKRKINTMQGVGKTTMKLIEQLCDRAGIEMLP